MARTDAAGERGSGAASIRLRNVPVAFNTARFGALLVPTLLKAPPMMILPKLFTARL